MIRLVLVDNHKLFRVSLKSLITSHSNCEVVFDVASVKAITPSIKNTCVNLVIFDPSSAAKNSFEILKELFPLASILILTDDVNRNNVTKFMDLGVSGFFSKEDSPLQLEMAIQEISGEDKVGEVKIGTVVREELISDVTYRQKKNIQFSDREMQVLGLVCMEKTNAEISNILGLSIRTVESHRRRMIDKTDCRSIIGVILKALDINSANFKRLKNTNQAS